MLTFYYTSVNSHLYKSTTFKLLCTCTSSLLYSCNAQVVCPTCSAWCYCIYMNIVIFPPCVHLVCAFACMSVFVHEVFSVVVNSLSHHLQEAEQPLGVGVYDTPTFSKPTSVKQVMDMPTYSDVFQSKVNIMHLDVYKPTNKCQSGLEQCFCTLYLLPKL